MESPVVANGVPRSGLRPEDAARLPRAFRLDDHDRPRAASEDNRWKNETAYAHNDSIAFDDSPPREDIDGSLYPNAIQPSLLSLDQTLELFQTKVEEARQDTEHALAGSEDVIDVVKPKLTLDLGHSNIARLPETVVDLIKAEVERLSLSHNQIWHIPLRFSECAHLRYLNIRSNAFREIPKGVYKLPLLEILDLSRNKIRKISSEIRHLQSLRVLSIVHNRVDDLPPDICEMTKLQILKIAENPLRFKLKKIIESKEAEVAFSEMTDNERETAVTAEIKRHLRSLQPTVSTYDAESTGDLSEGPTDTPKPMRRLTSSRFPVIPSTGLPESSLDPIPQSPSQSRPPPIPTRSHYRMMSSQRENVLRRPGVAPLVNGNERNRSNSESVLQASAAARNKRMGLVRKERADLDTVEEVKNNRHSHLRGFSHASVLKARSSILASPGGNTSSSPNSPRDVRKHRTGFVKRLSSLPEHKTETDWRNPIIDGAKGILYALYQIHPQISGLIAAIRGKDFKRNSLEFTFYNASTHVDRLNEALDRAEAVDAEDGDAVERVEEAIQRDCATCVMAYTHVTAQLQGNVSKVVCGTDARYVRTLMLLLYGSTIELTNAIVSFGIEVDTDERRSSSGSLNQIRPIPEEMSPSSQAIRTATPIKDRVFAMTKQGPRLRSDTTIQRPAMDDIPQFAQEPLPMQNPAPSQLPTPIHLTGSTLNGGTFHSNSSSFTNASTYNSATFSFSTVATLNSTVKYSNGPRSRSNSRNTNYPPSFTPSLASSVANTPRSGEAFNLPPAGSFGARVNPATGLTESQEDAVFERIYIALMKAYDAALQAIPIAKKQFMRNLESAEEHRQPKEVRELWSRLIHRCRQCLDVSSALQQRIVNMRINDPLVSVNGSGNGRNDPSFWQLCRSFMQSFVDLVTDMKDARELRLLAQEIVVVLRPVQKSSREAGRLIENSPWRYLTDSGSGTVQPPAKYSSANGAYANGGYMNGNTITPYSTTIPKLQFPQSVQPPFPPPIVPVPPLPGSATAMTNGTSPLSVPLPATPLSAALGPAAQATVPSTPASASAYGDSFFAGDVFQRAEALLNMPQTGGINFLNRR